MPMKAYKPRRRKAKPRPAAVKRAEKLYRKKNKVKLAKQSALYRKKNKAELKRRAKKSAAIHKK